MVNDIDQVVLHVTTYPDICIKKQQIDKEYVMIKIYLQQPWLQLTPLASY